MELPKDEDYTQETLESWVMDKVIEWRDHYDDNYREQHEEYYRLWRGRWAPEDRLRQSERSRLVTPALQQAVESSVAEVEEATFGRGRWFDIKDDFQDPTNSEDIAFTRKQLYEDMQYARARSGISEVLINAAWCGTGIGELYLEEVTEKVPAMQENTEMGVTAIGVIEKERFLVKLRPIMPQNFAIDPLATCIEEAMGCAIDIEVGHHQIVKDQEAGIYRDVEVGTVESDSELQPDQSLTYNTSDRVRLTKYYGLVPRDLYEKAYNEEEAKDEEEQDSLEAAMNQEEEKDSSYVEAIVVIANEDTLLKVQKSPYMMGDRPIVAFQWDTVPSRFWGRGVCEKGYNAQKALDTELRARIDGLALTIHPMMGVDATRMPRGAKYEVRPGKTILTNGRPSEILEPINFGNMSQVTFAQGQQLQDMVQQATGAVDTVGMQNAMNGEAAVGTVSMSLGAIIKRHKRTLLNFQENFLIPFVTKAAHRYMQFNPDLYKAQDYKFVASSSLGIIAREYEVTQLVQLLQTMPPESSMYNVLVQSIVEAMNLTNREDILNLMKQSQQPSPEQQQAAQMQQQMAMLQFQKAQLELAELQADVQHTQTETQLAPVDAQTRRLQALAKQLEPSEFEKVVKLLELETKQNANDIKAADVVSNENIAALQMMNQRRSN